MKTQILFNFPKCSTYLVPDPTMLIKTSCRCTARRDQNTSHQSVQALEVSLHPPFEDTESFTSHWQACCELCLSEGAWGGRGGVKSTAFHSRGLPRLLSNPPAPDLPQPRRIFPSDLCEAVSVLIASAPLYYQGAGALCECSSSPLTCSSWGQCA